MLTEIEAQRNAYLTAMFEPNDQITIRPIETWTENDAKKSHVLFDQIAIALLSDWLDGRLASTIDAVSAQQGNVFIGVCPRQAGDGTFELAWQIPTVRCLWADIDHCQPNEVLERIAADANLPEPSILVASGNGCHVYWLLSETLQTGAPAIGVHKEWHSIKGKQKPIQYINGDGGKIWLQNPETGRSIVANRPSLTTGALQIQDTLQGIAAAIGGDHTHDLSRILRLPGTMNRKNERNGDAPKSCELVFAYPERRYSFDLFSSFADKSPKKLKRTLVAAVQLPATRGLTPTRTDSLGEKILDCATAPLGMRSVTDFHLCCWALEEGIAKSDVWMRCQNVGKFVEAGEPYFDLTWDKAESHVKEKRYDQAHGNTNQAGSNGDYNGWEEEIDSAVPSIELTTDEKAVNDQVRAALSKCGQVFDYFGQLAVIADKNVDGHVYKSIRPLCKATLRELISSTCQFHSAGKRPSGSRKKGKDERIPKWCFEGVLAGGSWTGLPPLRGIVSCPLLRSNHTIAQTAGYDTQSGIYIDLTDEFPLVPVDPSPELVQESVALLLDLVADFPFATEPGRSAWLAAVLTPLARNAYSGVTGPLFLFDANVRGSGKTRLADICSLIATGRTIERQTLSNSTEETRKLITSLAVKGSRMVLLDNIRTSVDSPNLEAALTGSSWTDRKLGTNEMLDAVLNITWYATGNNVMLTGDISRRICHVRLESPLEHPEDRTDFKYTELLGHVEKNRPRLLMAALTILRGYIAAGCPDQQVPPWGGFEDWSAMVRNAIVWCGRPDPGETRVDVRESSDEEAETTYQLLLALQTVDPNSQGLRAADILEMTAGRHATCSHIHETQLRYALEGLCGCGREKVNSNTLGKKLSQIRERVIRNLSLHKRVKRGQNCWFVQQSGGHGGHGWADLPQPDETEQPQEEQTYVENLENKSTTSTTSTTADLFATANDPLLFTTHDGGEIDEFDLSSDDEFSDPEFSESVCSTDELETLMALGASSGVQIIITNNSSGPQGPTDAADSDEE